MRRAARSTETRVGLMVDGVDLVDRCSDPADDDAWGWCYRRPTTGGLSG